MFYQLDIEDDKLGQELEHLEQEGLENVHKEKRNLLKENENKKKQ